MSSDLSIDSFDNSLSEFYLAPPLNYGNWNGRQIAWRGIPKTCSEIERQILNIYTSGNHVLAYQLAILYFEEVYPSYEIQSVKSSKPKPNSHTFNPQRLIEFYDRIILEQNHVLYEAGLIKDRPPPLEPISPTNFPALWAWQTYCLENGISLSTLKTHSGGFKEFWREYKKEIIIAAVVIVVAVTVAVVIVTTVGTGTNVAVATGAGAIQAAIDGYASSDDPDPNAQNFQYEPKVDKGIQNFAKAIGATDVDNRSGAVTVIETHAISSEITPEILTDLVTNWNENLPTGPLEQSDPQSSGLLPWVKKGISYFQWKEREYREQLLNELVNKSNTPASDNAASVRSALEEEVLPKVTNPSEWVEVSQEPRPKFNDRIVEDFLKDIERTPDDSAKNNYASKADHFFDGFQSPPPFQPIPLIGKQTQSTINYHCGIGNSIEEIIEGGTCLYEALGEEFAVQPHLLHSPSVLKGLGFVALEQGNNAKAKEVLQQINRSPEVPNFSGFILESSNIQKAINYQVENLSKTAQNIIDQDNPNLKQLHVTFSNGGYIFNEALKQLPPEYRKTIIVVTTGSTAIINRDLAHKAYNIIGDKDKGSQICNGGLKGIEKNKEKADVDVIPQTETLKWIGGHYFMQPDYQTKISEFLNDKVVNEYEIY